MKPFLRWVAYILMVTSAVLLLVGAFTGFARIFVLAVVSCIVSGSFNAWMTLSTREDWDGRGGKS